jgi:mRNA-degrading endonuclease toxin of MazEF toxin-antitoxin module
VILPSNLKATGAVLVDQIRVWTGEPTNARYLGQSTDDVVEEIIARLRALLGL